MKRVFLSLKVFLFAFVLCAIVVGGFIALRFVKAGPQWVTVYPSSCLGGWENPSLAQGEPDLSPDSVPADFDKTNSAVLAHANSQIFCGSFPFQSVENTNIQGITLKLSWALKDGGEKVKAEPEKKERTEENQASVIEAVQPDETVPVEPEILIEVPKPEVVPDVLPKEETEADVPIEAEPEPQDTSDTDSSDPGSGEPSAFNWIVKTVYAETIEENTEKTSTEVEAKIETIAIDALVKDPSPEALFEVKYTTNGKEWHSLGTVNRVSLPDAVFTIPTAGLMSWESLKDFQVRIDRLTTLEDPVTYLDGMSLTVTYVPSLPDLRTEVVAIPDTLHISGIVVEEGGLQLHVERIDDKETLIITSDTSIGGLTVFGGPTQDTNILNTFVDSTEYKIPAETLGEGSFAVVATPDPDHCEAKSRETCAAETGARSNSLMIQTYVVPNSI